MLVRVGRLRYTVLQAMGVMDIMDCFISVSKASTVSQDNVKSLQRRLTASNGRVDCVRFCLEMHANVNTRVFLTESSPQHNAVMYGSVDVVRLLLDAGAIIDAEDRFGWTPLRECLQSNHHVHKKIARILGSKIVKVKLNKNFPAIPDWAYKFAAFKYCRSVAVTIVGICKHHRTNVTCHMDINVIKLIGKHVWSMRMDDAWSSLAPQNGLANGKCLLC
jgi:hypothetical protein